MVATNAGPRDGWSIYMRDWRERHPFASDKNRMQTRARGRALTRLKELHPDEFEDLYQGELWDEHMEWEVDRAETGR